jgi:chemotaxis signal transduction protein
MSDGTINDVWLAPSVALTRSVPPEPLAKAGIKDAGLARFGYRVGSLRLLVGRGVLSELLAGCETYPIPNVPAPLRGYVNRQGALVPVWDLKLLLEPPSANQEIQTPESILVLGRGDQRVGIVIDGMPRALKCTDRVARLPQLPDELAPYVHEAWYAENSLWFEFAHEDFFRAQTVKAAA